MEDNRVSDRQFVRRDNNFAGVTNNWINCLTPPLVADDTLTVFTSCLGVVPVAVIQGCFVVRHSLISRAPACLFARKINRTRHLLELGRLPSRRGELYDFSAVQRRGTLQPFPTVLRYINSTTFAMTTSCSMSPYGGAGMQFSFQAPMALPNPSALTTYGLAQLELVQECFANGA